MCECDVHGVWVCDVWRVGRKGMGGQDGGLELPKGFHKFHLFSATFDDDVRNSVRRADREVASLQGCKGGREAG